MNSTCRLCLEQRPLERSHIFPEFLHRHCSDNKRRAVELSISGGSTRIRQTSEWEYLLCRACEKRLHEHETYFARIWYAFPVLPELPGPSVQLSDLDYRSFKLFHLSLLWRAAVAKHASFDTVNLGPHAEKLRKILLVGDPGPVTRYPVSGVVLLDNDGGVQHQVLMPYALSRNAGHHFYWALYAGCAWTVTVSSHYNELARADLTSDGRIFLPSQRLVEISPFMQRIGTFLRNKANANRKGPA